MRIELAARGPATPETVWSRYSRIPAWTDWAPQLREVAASADELAVGVRGTVTVIGGLRAPFVVTSCRPAERTWSWTVRVGPIRLDLEHGVQPHGAGSRTTLGVAGPAIVVLGYAPLARLALHRLVS